MKIEILNTSWVSANKLLSYARHRRGNKVITCHRHLWVSFTLLLLGCTNPAEQQSDPGPPNILVIIGDDMGVETMSSYGIGTPTAVTPNLDQLAARGMRFERFWSQAACSPTRAAILTGRYGFRTGVVTPLYYGWSKMDPAIVPQPGFFYAPAARMHQPG